MRLLFAFLALFLGVAFLYGVAFFEFDSGSGFNYWKTKLIWLFMGLTSIIYALFKLMGRK